MHNRMHDWAYVLGFTEATWNGQTFNFGRNPTGENDPVLGAGTGGRRRTAGSRPTRAATTRT